MNIYKIDKENRLYVMKEAGGYSCLGFDVLEDRARALANELSEIWREKTGTLKAYRRYRTLVGIARHLNETIGWRSESQLSPQLIGLEGKRVEVVTTYGETRRFYVGKSTGFIPSHLEILRKDSRGGIAAETEYKSIRIISGQRR